MKRFRERIILIGSGGAGKSTLARELGEALQRPVHHLDALYWSAGWVEPDKQGWRKAQEELCAQDSWIMDGNYGGTLDLRLAAADTILFLDFPRVLCLYRALKRTFVYRGTTRPDMTPGCPERIDLKFLRWIWNYPATRRPGILKKLAKLDEAKEIVILRSPNEAVAYVARVRAESVIL